MGSEGYLVVLSAYLQVVEFRQSDVFVSGEMLCGGVQQINFVMHGR